MDVLPEGRQIEEGKQNSWEATLENSNVKGVDEQQQKTAKEANKKQEKKKNVCWELRKKEVQGSMKQQH